MRSAIVGIVIGLVIGVVVGARVIAPSLPEISTQNAKVSDKAITASKEIEWKAPPPKPIEEIQKVWRFTGLHTSTLPHLGPLSSRLQSILEEISRGDLHIPYREPGSLVPNDEVFSAVAAGTLDAVFLSPLEWADKSAALNLIGGIPFGPSPHELLAWLSQENIQKSYEEIYHQQNVHGIPCGLTPAQSGGWFRQKIVTVDDLKGKSFAIQGLGAMVVEKIGMIPMKDSGGQIFVGLESGKLDGALFHTPAIDQHLDIQKLAPFAYFPGWQRQAGIVDLLVNLKKWQSLSPTHQVTIKAACGDNLLAGYAAIEAEQFAALNRMQNKGVNVRRWPVAVIAAFKESWEQVAVEQAENDKEFKLLWGDLVQFRKDFALWDEINRLD
ncbi:MAG: C4-dicarboxylate ABC transporter [Alphaproteobacteria bacterium]|nr:C4-dicarboxylate ABC transporter [Alphaproteobacteria bacterium]